MYIILYVIVKKHPHRINKYIDMTLHGKISIPDEDLKEEIVKKIEKDNSDFQNNRNVIFCPNCGEKFLKGTDFCLSCGKDLRLI
jgi:hypothetical protein